MMRAAIGRLLLWLIEGERDRQRTLAAPGDVHCPRSLKVDGNASFGGSLPVVGSMEIR